MTGPKARWIDDPDQVRDLLEPTQSFIPPARATGLLDDAMAERHGWTDPYPESWLHPAFRNALHQIESPIGNYRAFNPDKATKIRTGLSDDIK